jgi:hypothetical protein
VLVPGKPFQLMLTKHSSFLSYGCKKFYNIDPWSEDFRVRKELLIVVGGPNWHLDVGTLLDDDSID